MTLPEIRRIAATLAMLALAGSFLAACRSARDAADSDSASITKASAATAEVAAILIGRFSSREQSEVDESYFAIRLTHVPIWQDREDGPWLYVEQAAETTLDRPYRQRVYRLVTTDDGVRSDVYTLPGDPLEFVGAKAERFVDMTPDQLALRDGCAIHLTDSGNGHYEGATHGKGCLSTLRGAAYATSEVSLRREALRTWDRGFDANDEQVWGAVDGPYEFLRLE